MELISLSYTEDNTKAFLYLNPLLKDSYSPNKILELVLEKLKKDNIDNYDTDKINLIVESNKFGGKILISEGVLPKRGADGYIKYNFPIPDFETILLNHIKDEKEGEDKEITANLFILPVKKGDMLAQIIQPTIGDPGKDVFGKPIPGKKGRIASLKTEKNTYLDIQETGANAYASTDGIAYFNEDRLNVDKITIADQTNLENFIVTIDGIKILKFEDTVIINCPLPRTTRIETDGSIFINTTIENIKIDAKRDVMINGNIQGKCKITNQGILFAKSITDSTISTKLLLCKHLLSHCNIKATDGISILSKQGTITGGTIHAYGNITTKILGSKSNDETHIVLGLSAKEVSEKSMLITNYNKLKTELNTHIVNIDQYKRYIQQKKASGQKFLDAYERSYEKSYKEELKIVNKGIAGLQKIKDRHDIINKYAAQTENVSISVSDKIYPNVSIDINGRNLSINEFIQEGHVFSLQEDAVLSLPIKETSKLANPAMN